ncbi:hypothetical protein Tco_1274077 [Tanacetum coccineum]
MGRGLAPKPEDPNRDGERGFGYLTSALVSSKADHEGYIVYLGEDPIWALKGRPLSRRGGYVIKPPSRMQCMSVKNTLAIQRCELSRKELDEFLSFYPIPSEYRVILPTSTQTILDAPPGYIGLYTHCFSLANLRLPLNDFFCEAYDYEPSVELFHGFINLCKAGSWLTVQKRSKKHIPSLLAIVITRIEGWHHRFLFIQDTIVPSKFPQLLLKENMLNVKSFKDELPSGCITHSFNVLVVTLDVFFRNFIYTEEDEDLTFLTKDLSPGFNIGSPSVSINTEPVRTDEEPAVEHVTEPATEPVNERVGTIADSGGIPKEILLKLASGSSTSRTVRAKASTLKDDTHVLSISDDDEGLEDCLELKDATACHLKISAITPPAWKGFLDNHLDVDLLDLHDHVMRARELARKEECEGLRAKCEAAMTDFDRNPVVLLLREKMSSLAAEVSLSAIESKVAFLEAENANLEATKASLCQEIEEVNHDRREVVSKVVPYACIELLHSDELGRLIGKLVSSIITFGRCKAYEQVARIKEPFDLLKVKGYHPSYEKEHIQANNDLATATFSWLNEYAADASASVEALLSKSPKPFPSRTHIPLPSSHLATPSSFPSSKPMSPPADIMKPSPSPNE